MCRRTADGEMATSPGHELPSSSTLFLDLHSRTFEVSRQNPNRLVRQGREATRAPPPGYRACPFLPAIAMRLCEKTTAPPSAEASYARSDEEQRATQRLPTGSRPSAAAAAVSDATRPLALHLLSFRASGSALATLPAAAAPPSAVPPGALRGRGQSLRACSHASVPHPYSRVCT